MSNADRMIERQIAIELDRLNSIFPDEAEKVVIIQRIAELKAMLPATPVRVEHQPLTFAAITSVFATAFRNRKNQ